MERVRMRSKDGLVDFAGGVNPFVVEGGADDDVSVVKPQVVAFVRLYFIACFTFVNSGSLGGKEGVCWGRHSVKDMGRLSINRAYYMTTDRPNKKVGAALDNHALSL